MGILKIYDGAQWVPLASAITATKKIYAELPTVYDAFPLFQHQNAVTITRVTEETDTGTVSWNLQQRDEEDELTAVTGVTELFSADSTATSTWTETTSGFQDDTVPADTAVWWVASAVTGSPSYVKVTVEFTED